jgi:hypothetical protein
VPSGAMCKGFPQSTAGIRELRRKAS